ncbi:MAG: helix-turn-helix domain-containing protein [Thermodesulfobacteriota bacterium]
MLKAELNIDTEALIEEIVQRVVETLRVSETGNAAGDSLLTVEELCEYLHVKRGWVYQQVHSEAIPFLKAGNKLLFRRSEIDEYLAKDRKKPF